MRLNPTLLALLAVAGMVGSACSYRNDDLNRVVDPYWEKAYFNHGDEWYVRATVTDAPPEHGWLSIADGDWMMLEKIRWEVTESHLIAWRTYSPAPGSENELYEGAEGVYRGMPVAIFPITDHFDIRRDFNSLTGEKSNVIVEDRNRLWYDREFMRVDWANNQVPTWKFHITLNVTGTVLDFIPGGPARSYVQSQYDPASPRRWRFEDDYFEFTNRVQVKPDIYSYVGFYGEAYAWDSAAAIIDIRHTFMKVPKSDYEPLPMPPTVVLEDENGREVRDEKGFAVRVPINDRFGFFGTLGRNTFDENRGMLTSGQIFHASRFNIWENHKHADGSSIPMEARTPKPIVYYTNVDHPKQLMNASRRVAADWNRVFRDAVFHAQPGRYSGVRDEHGIPSDVPDMFVLNENSCNVANVKATVASLQSTHPRVVENVIAAAKRTPVNNLTVAFDGTIKSVEDRINAANEGIDNLGAPGVADFTSLQAQELQALADLERICSSLEYYTRADVTLGRPAPQGVTPFVYQRLGDTRFSLMNAMAQDFQSGWLGLGPPYADPLTGETISATANVAVGLLDRSAARAAQFVSALNGELDADSLTFGYDVERYMNQKLLDNGKLISKKPGRELRERMDREFDVRRGNRELLKEIPVGRAESRLGRFANTPVEQKIITQQDVALFAHMAPEDVADLGMEQALLEAVSPLRNDDLLHPGQKRDERIMRMGQRAMDAPEMIDNLLIGQALAYRDMSYAERFKKLREDMYVAVQLHEVGHNVGLFHNFAGSTDAINYGPKFWELQELPADMDDAIAVLASRSSDPASAGRIASLEKCIDVLASGGIATPDITTQQCLRQTEGLYSSIMDYHGNWNADFNGLGTYDAAAIKFAYTQLLEVFPTDKLAANVRNAPAGTIKDNLFYNDWRGIPDMFAGGSYTEKVANMHDRQYVKMNWNRSSTRFQPLPNEVPYRFGYGAYPEPTVMVFDFGPDTRTNAAYQLNLYYQHYFFTHFARNRLWDFNVLSGPLSRDDRVMGDFSQKMQWYFFYKATDPRFTGSYAEEDFLTTAVTGLNHLNHVLAEPAAGDFHTRPAYALFGITNLPPEDRTTDPLDIMVPWVAVPQCEARITNGFRQVDGRTVGMGEPRAGYRSGRVDLGDGRPFFVGFTDDYVDFFIRYVGHYWTKQYAILNLGWPYAWFPRVDASADFRLFDVSWYRMFPEEVGQIYYNLITENRFGMGGHVDANGNYIRPDVLNLDGSKPSYAGLTPVIPQLANNHRYFSVIYANAFLESPYDDQMDFTKTMRVALEGGVDDMRAFDDAAARDAAAGCVTDDPTNPPACATVATFTHPVSGLTLRGLKVGNHPVAFDMITRLNVLKVRFERMRGCVESLDAGVNPTDPYCSCMGTDDRVNCLQNLTVTPAGTGFCGPIEVRNRAEQAREALDDLVDFTSDLRFVNNFLSGF